MSSPRRKTRSAVAAAAAAQIPMGRILAFQTQAAKFCGMHALNNFLSNCPLPSLRSFSVVRLPDNVPSTHFVKNINYACTQILEKKLAEAKSKDKSRIRKDFKCFPRSGNYSDDVMAQVISELGLDYDEIYSKGISVQTTHQAIEQNRDCLGFIVRNEDFGGHWICLTGPKFLGDLDALRFLDSVEQTYVRPRGLYARKYSAGCLDGCNLIWKIYDNDDARTQADLSTEED